MHSHDMKGIPMEYVHNASLDISNLPEDVRWKIEHARLHEKHKGHESMHSSMLLILLTAVILSQIGIVQWKKRHYKSYQRCSLLGLWLIPLMICIHSHWWRFVFIWVIFTILTGLVMSLALQKPIKRTTPRWVYKWFYLIHMQSYAMGVAGYMIVMLTMMGFNLIFGAQPQTWLDFGVMLLFYGVYYGVLGRDIAEVVTDKMACTIGYYTESGVPYRQLEDDVCAVCAQKILVKSNEDAVVEERYTLPCGHSFHEFCIRGWCIVGKKQTCPYCKEKVDLKRIFKNPWEKPHVLYGNFLDFIRYLVVWQPVVIFGVHCLNNMLGLE